MASVFSRHAQEDRAMNIAYIAMQIAGAAAKGNVVFLADEEQHAAALSAAKRY